MEKKIYQKWWLYVLILFIIGSILAGSSFLFKPKFEVTDFSITSDTTDYTNITNRTTYTGKGIVTTNSKNGTYLVAIKVTLESGGDELNEQEYVTMVTVYEGKGQFTTYDSGDVGTIKRPKYNFEVIGYIKF